MKEKNSKKQTASVSTIGGQALLEGVMMRGKTAMAMAVRGESGEILLETEKIKPKSKAARLPVLRGVISFVSSLVLGVKVTMRSAEAIGDEDEQLGKAAEIFAVVLGLLLALGLFFFLPWVLSELFYNFVYDNILVKNLVSGVIRVTLFVLYLFGVSHLKDIKRTFMYHGAEHRTINCFEKGMPLTVQNVQKCSTRHNRCGTTFMFLVMIISIIVFAVADWIFFKVIPMDKGFVRSITFMGLKFLLLPLVAGLSYEVLFLFAKMPDNWVSAILRAPGLALQRLTTKTPDDQMAEVAIASFNAVLDMENNHDKKTVKFDEINIEKAKEKIDALLNEINAEQVEGKWILCAVSGKKRSEVSGLKHLTRKQYKNLISLLEKRKNMPLDYCLGTSCFYGRDIMVDDRVLIPRMETETLCETAINTIIGTVLNPSVAEENIAVLDLCTGSGCIALTIAKETRVRVTAADISDKALEIAAENLKDANVELLKSDMFSGLSGRAFDMIVCNPPYVKSEAIDFLQKEVRCQPRIALDGGGDGLDFYRVLAGDAPSYLKKGGYLIVEVGFDQAEQVAALFLSSGGIDGFDRAEIIKDLEGIDRVVKAYRR